MSKDTLNKPEDEDRPVYSTKTTLRQRLMNDLEYHESEIQRHQELLDEASKNLKFLDKNKELEAFTNILQIGR